METPVSVKVEKVENALVLENVSKSFGNRKIIDNISFEVKKGEVFGFLGPNGAGKTTTIKMILGLLSVDSGKISVAGHDVERQFESAMQYVSGIVESPDMYDYLSGYDNLLLHARACNVPESRISEVAYMVGMQKRINDKFKTYSLGMKQRLGIAQALLHNPKIMILDEPTNGLDPMGIKEVRDLIKHLANTTGLAVLVSSHILQEMQELCDTVGIIHNGVIINIASIEELTHMSGGIVRYNLYPQEKGIQAVQKALPDRIVEIGQDYLDLQADVEEIDVINRFFMDNDIQIRGIAEKNLTLEQRFIEITGGGSIIE